MADLFTSLPRQIYCYADRSFMSQGQRAGFEPCSWFGLTSIPNRAWGLSVLLQCGATYTHLPPHALAFSEEPEPEWSLQQSQKWDTFGVSFAVGIYEQLAGRDVDAYTAGKWIRAEYLLTAQHFGDPYSAAPEQAKQFHFLRTDGDRLTILPGNCCIFHDPAFTRVKGKPDWLRTQTEVYACESGEPWDTTITEETA